MWLSSFGEDIEVAVIGATGGIGGALTRALAADPAVLRVFGCSRREARFASAKVCWLPIDIEQEASVAAAARTLSAEAGTLQLVIVATGILHDGAAMQPEKSWAALDAARLERSFRINSIGPALVAKHFLPLLSKPRRAAFAALSARVGSIADNRLGGWYGYRASKAALHMLIRTAAVELARRNPMALCVALHPGTVDTGLSKPFQANVSGDRLFSPDEAAARLLSVLDRLVPEDSGQAFAWDGSRLPF
jgi:NAD(P)-dependent dehydrogenase (short-subunit alcohol dehydrogenase family)